MCIALLSAQAPQQTVAQSGGLTTTQVSDETSSGSCFNPLFKTHWAGKSDVRHLESTAQLQFGLSLCPMWNSQQSCCSMSFENVLSKSFQRWVDHWTTKSTNLRNLQIEFEKMKISKTFVQADRIQRALFDAALLSLAPVVEWSGTCFDVLLEYMAGMLCFSCDSDWMQKVFPGQDGRSVSHLRIADHTNEALWQSCRHLGAAAAKLETRVADSMLAKSIEVPMEDLSMFLNKISVSQYMGQLGLSPMRGPSEKTFVVKPDGSRVSTDAQSRLLTPAGSVDPIRLGRASGFHTDVFPRRPIHTGIAPAIVLRPCIVAIVISLVTVNMLVQSR